MLAAPALLGPAARPHASLLPLCLVQSCSQHRRRGASLSQPSPIRRPVAPPPRCRDVTRSSGGPEGGSRDLRARFLFLPFLCLVLEHVCWKECCRVQAAEGEGPKVSPHPTPGSPDGATGPSGTGDEPPSDACLSELIPQTQAAGVVPSFPS